MVNYLGSFPLPHTREGNPITCDNIDERTKECIFSPEIASFYENRLEGIKPKAKNVKELLDAKSLREICNHRFLKLPRPLYIKDYEVSYCIKCGFINNETHGRLKVKGD